MRRATNHDSSAYSRARSQRPSLMWHDDRITRQRASTSESGRCSSSSRTAINRGIASAVRLRWNSAVASITRSAAYSSGHDACEP